MRFLIDAQWPAALARWLEAQGHHAAHVYDIGLLEAEDKTSGEPRSGAMPSPGRG